MPIDINTAPRNQLLTYALTGLQQVVGDKVVAAAIANIPGHGEWDVVAIGKAALAMVRGAESGLGPRINRVLIVTKEIAAAGVPNIGQQCELHIGGHPIPTAASFAAGSRLTQFLAEVPVSRGLLFLLSGGASALVEAPRAGIDLRQLQAANRWLLGSGVPIKSINGVRTRLSAIKGGQLWSYIKTPHVAVLLISDVEGDDPALIGSGPLFAAGGAEPEIHLPPWLAALSNGDESVGASVPPAEYVEVVASLDQAKLAVAEAAESDGQVVEVVPEFISGDAGEAGRRLATKLLSRGPGVTICGGETTVRLPRHPGSGGRCQHLALAAAEVLDGHDGVWLLALGSDGNDGPGEDAGALVDGGTIARGSLAGLSAAEALESCDSGTYLAATGDLIQTGITDTNVMDLIIGLKL